MSVTDMAFEDHAEAKRPNPFVRVYRGETKFDFVGRRRWWFAVSGVIIVLGLVSFGAKGFNWGIDFKGGTAWQVAANGATVSDVQSAVSNAGVPGATVQILGHGSSATVQVQADLTKESSAQQAAKKTAVTNALARLVHISPNRVSLTDVGPTWGSQISEKAIIAVFVFFVVVVLYISFRFEWKMALAALIAVIHDLLITAGIYSLFGFQITPDTVIAILTILGYSLYDTVVVFDRVRDNTQGVLKSGELTYSDMVNLSMNQTLARSINTSAVAILPVLAVLLIGSNLLGATTLQSYGLALFVGLLSGAYSSIFIASPVLCMMKEREDRWVQIAARLAKRGQAGGFYSAVDAATMSTAISVAASGQVNRGGGAPAQKAGAKRSGPIRPGSGSGDGAGGGGGSGGGGTAVMDRPSGTSSSAASRTAPAASGSRTSPSQGPRPRKGKRKRKR